MNPVVIVMVKAPRAGQAKTRLAAPPLSAADAAELAGCFARDAVANARRVVRQVIVAYAPSDGRRALEGILPRDERLVWLEQRGADLGARLTNAARDAAAREFSPLIVIGADSPTLPRSFIEEAIRSLAAGESDVALAPADDGGYCLVGFRQCPDGLFQNVEWSTPRVYEQTAANAARLNLRTFALPRWYDVDTFPDLLRLRDEIFSDERARERAFFTHRWLRARAALFPETT